MKTIKEIEKTTIINKSKFITNLYSVDNILEVDNYLNLIKDKYKGATHYCYAYIIDNIKRFSDDNEPSKTAGMPILNVLEKNNLNHVLCIVTRYFGGIKLGVGGLTRAYSNSTINAINDTIMLDIIDGYKISICFNYTDSNNINKLLENSIILNKTFDTNIIYEVLVDNDIFNKLKELNISIKIIDKVIIKK